MDFLPHLVSWNVTRRCNLACPHCYIDASMLSDRTGELSTSEGLQVVDQIADVHREAMIVFSGGEPLLREDLPQLIERASSRGMMTLLGTNGTLLDGETARRLKSRGLTGAGISLDSLDPGRHDAFRGVPAAWKRAVAAIEACREVGLEFQIQTTLTRQNAHELDALAAFAREEGARAFVVFFLVCTGRGEGMTDIDPDAYEAALDRIVALSRSNRRGFMVRPRCAPHFRRVLHGRDPDSPLLQTDAGRCLAGRTYCRITPEGLVTPCPYMDVAAGDLRRESFERIWTRSELFARLRAPRLEGKCGECAYREVCGGCRARALASTGDLMGADPSCRFEGAAADPVRLAGPEPIEGISWTPEAEARLLKVPPFVRGFVRGTLERRALERGCATVTAQFIEEARALFQLSRE